MPRRSGRPQPVRLHDIVVSVVRGPRDTDGRWYCRVATKTDDGVRALVMPDGSKLSGWYTKEEMDAVAIRAATVGQRDSLPAEDDRMETIRDLLETYIGDCEDLCDAGQMSKFTLRSYRRACGRWTRRLGALPLVEVSTATLADHRDLRLREKAMPQTVRDEIQAICRAFTWARRMGRICRPTPEKPHVRDRRTRDKRAPTAEEHAEAMAWLRAFVEPDPGNASRSEAAHKRSADALDLQRLYGARIGEVADIHVDQVDLESGRLVLVGKTGTRTVPILDAARPILERWRHGGATIWGISGEGMRGTTASHLADAVEALGHPRWTSHGYRTLFCSEARASGVPRSAVAQFIGNSEKVINRHYDEEDIPLQFDTASRMGLLGPGNVTSIGRVRGSQ